MKDPLLLVLAGTLVPAILAGQAAAPAPAPAPAPAAKGSFARIAVLRPHDGKTVDFEAGYVRHLEWHRQAKDPWTWFGWTVWAGDRQRWFVYATFGHSASELDHSVSPGEDERDNVSNVAPHARFAGSALFEYRPLLSSGTGEPRPAARLELTTVDLLPAAEKAFEAAVGETRSTLEGETLWYRMVAGGSSPRYVRLRPAASLSELLQGAGAGAALPASAGPLVSKTVVEILNLRPQMSYNLPPAPR